VTSESSSAWLRLESELFGMPCMTAVAKILEST